MTDWVLVPIEPTDAMISAGIVERHEQAVPEAWSLATSNIYRTMLEHRPDAPEPSQAQLVRVARALLLHYDADPDVYIGMHGGLGHWLDAARAAITAAFEDPGA